MMVKSWLLADRNAKGVDVDHIEYSLGVMIVER